MKNNIIKVTLVYSLILLAALSALAQTPDVELKGVELGSYEALHFKYTTVGGLDGFISTDHLNDGKVYRISFEADKYVNINDAKKLRNGMESKYEIVFTEASMKDVSVALGLEFNYSETEVREMSKLTYLYMAEREGIEYLVLALKSEEGSLKEFMVIIIDKQLQKEWEREQQEAVNADL